jgi:hypothetical protein
MDEFPLIPRKRVKPLTPERLDWLAAKARAVKIEKARVRANKAFFKLFARWAGRDEVPRSEP